MSDCTQSVDMNCTETHQAQRYHDDELSPIDRHAFEAHLDGCVECRERLDDLRAISRLVHDSPRQPLPDTTLARLRDRMPWSEDRAVLRLAGWFTATAAAILIAAVVSWPSQPIGDASQPLIWEAAAATDAADLNDSADTELLAVAQWMADDLAESRSGELR